MDSLDAPAWTPLAHLLRPQGRKGEILADLLFDAPERFLKHPAVFLAPLDFAGPVSEARPAHVSNYWLPTGKNQGRIVLHFEGTESISQAELLAGLGVLIPRSERLPLEEGAEYVEDLIGCAVFDGESQIGTLQRMDFSTGKEGENLPDVAPMLTVVTRGGGEILIPYVRAFLRSVDVQARQIRMTLPSGLVELNRPHPDPTEEPG